MQDIEKSEEECLCGDGGCAYILFTKRYINVCIVCVAVVQLLSRVLLFVTPWTAAQQVSCPLVSLRVCSDLCAFNWWSYPTISFSAALFSFCLQSFPASGSSPMSWFFASGGQSNHLSTSSTNPQIPNSYYIQEVIFYSSNDPVS